MDDIDGSPTASTVGEYAYNGLNWRIMRQADTDLDNDLDQQRMMYYSATPGMWQLLEEDVWDDWTAQTPGDIDRHVQYVWGARYIDDIILRREDRSDGQDPGPDGDYADDDDITRYYLTDVQFSPVAIVDHTAAMIERISYTPYGEARHHRMADLTGDGHTDYIDYLILHNNLGGFGAGDIDYDGDVDTTDEQALWADFGAGTAAGRLSYASEDNIIGYDGYIFNVETCEYSVRHRCYSPTLGRWLQRDVLGYIDGLSLFEYVASGPHAANDPSGASALQLNAADLSSPPAAAGDAGIPPCMDADPCCPTEVYLNFGRLFCLIDSELDELQPTWFDVFLCDSQLRERENRRDELTRARMDLLAAYREAECDQQTGSFYRRAWSSQDPEWPVVVDHPTPSQACLDAQEYEYRGQGLQPTGDILMAVPIGRIAQCLRVGTVGKVATCAARPSATAGTAIIVKGQRITGQGVVIGAEAARKMGARGVSCSMIDCAVRKGRVFWDPDHATVAFILENGFASGKHLRVSVNPVTQKCASVIRYGGNAVPPRMIPLCGG